MRRYGVKVKCLLLLVCFLLFLLGKIVMQNKKKEAALTAWNNKIFNAVKETEKKTIICYKRRRLFLLDTREDNYATAIQKIEKLPIEYSDYRSYDMDILPFRMKNFIFVLQSHVIEILDNGRVYTKTYLRTQQIEAITYPVEYDNGICFYSVNYDKVSKIYSFEKIVYKDHEISVEPLSQLMVPDGFLARWKYAEICFFIIKNNIIHLILRDKKKVSYIFQFSMDGRLIKKDVSAEIFIPTSFDDAVYYLSKKDLEKDNWNDPSFVLMKDGVEIAAVNFPISQGYFVSKHLIYFVFYDSDKVERFDFVNGPWPPVPMTYFYHVDSNRFEPRCFKYLWRDGNFFIRSLVRENYILIIP